MVKELIILVSATSIKLSFLPVKVSSTNPYEDKNHFSAFPFDLSIPESGFLPAKER
jgi:hypothetical protein